VLPEEDRNDPSFTANTDLWPLMLADKQQERVDAFDGPRVIQQGGAPHVVGWPSLRRGHGAPLRWSPAACTVGLLHADTKFGRIFLILAVGHLAPSCHCGFGATAAKGMLGLARDKFPGTQAGAPPYPPCGGGLFLRCPKKTLKLEPRAEPVKPKPEPTPPPSPNLGG
jgi:hypothetical protein